MLVIVFAVYFKVAVVPWLVESGPPDKALASRLKLKGVADTITQFERDCGRLPWGFDEFFNPSEGSDIADQWQGPYFSGQPSDAWGHHLQYRCPGLRSPESYDLWSVGPDGQDGTDDDIWHPN